MISPAGRPQRLRRNLAVRVLADLPNAERILARTASLLPRFSSDLIAEATAVRHGEAERFCRRSLVSHDGHTAFPHRLHDAVRQAVVGEDVGHPGAWSRRDRLAAAETLVEALRRRHDKITDDPLGRLDVLELVTWVAAEQQLHLPWLLEALTDLPSLARTAERVSEAAAGTWMWHVRRMFDAWRIGDHAGRREHLERLLDTEVPVEVRHTAARFLAYNLRTSSLAPRALQVLTGLLAEDPESDLLRYQVAKTLREVYRYVDLDAFLAANPIREPSAALRLASDLAFDRGDVVAGYEGAVARAAELRRVGRFRVALENEEDALWRGALAGYVAAAECDSMIAELDRHGTRLSLRTAFAAKAICGIADPNSLSEMFAAADQLIADGRGFQGWREWIPAVLHGLRHDDHALIAQVRAAWLSMHSQTGPNFRILDRLLVFDGCEPVLPALLLGTEEERARIDGRWTSVFRDILSR
jgi:hypothetical protein